jgi:hypothetical protein
VSGSRPVIAHPPYPRPRSPAGNGTGKRDGGVMLAVKEATKAVEELEEVGKGKK